MRTVPSLLLALSLLGCPITDDPEPGSEPEPLDLPDDPALRGVPVGVMTLIHDSATFDVWYPAPDAVSGEPTGAIDMNGYVPQVVADALGEFTLPDVKVDAVRDAPLRVPEDRYPVVVFSHGFGGFREQSVDFTTHLASRGYVVVAADHPGRSLGAVLPCIFTPVLEGCDLEAWGGDDTAPEQIDDLMDWLALAAVEEGGTFAGALDLDHAGLSGHSAGGATTSRVGQDDERFTALLPMGGAAETARDVPTMLMGATCDGMFEMETMEEIHGSLADGALLEIRAAGHLAFTDLCALELGAFAETYLEPRDDINPLFLDSLVLLAIDGCPDIVPETPPTDECTDGYLPLETSRPIVRHYATAFFDQHLRGSTQPLVPDAFPDATLR